MITKFHAKGYGPLKEVTCNLTPLHAFIGPNDSGKSTLLKAIVSLLNQIAMTQPQYFLPGSPRDFEMVFNDNTSFMMSPNFAPAFNGEPNDSLVKWIKRGARLCRFEADALRSPSSLATEHESMNWVDQRGWGLPGALDILLRRNDGSFQTISDEFVTFFPTVNRLELPLVTLIDPQTQRADKRPQLGIVLRDGTTVDASSMSEGMFYFLAYATLSRLSGAAFLAVEEPETGLHPSRIEEIVRILRSISESGTQVVIATHSPLVINELQQDEVSVVTRTVEGGTVVTPITATVAFERRFKTYALGELWLAYANGRDEGPLLQGRPREPAKP